MSHNSTLIKSDPMLRSANLTDLTDRSLSHNRHNLPGNCWESVGEIWASIDLRLVSSQHDQERMESDICLPVDPGTMSRRACLHRLDTPLGPQSMWAKNFGTHEKSHSLGGREGPRSLFSGMLFFCYLGAHARFQNPETTPSGRKVRASEEERGKRCNTIKSGHYILTVHA